MEEHTNGNLPTQAFLQPIAAPSILGLYAFAGSTLIVAAELAGWYGDSQTALYLAPFAAAFGGSPSSPPGCGHTRSAMLSPRPCMACGALSGSASVS